MSQLLSGLIFWGGFLLAATIAVGLILCALLVWDGRGWLR